MTKLYVVLMLLFFAAASPAQAQDDIFMYGKIFTDDNHTYEGAIRWGKEEVYWSDIFNAAKEENRNIRFLSSDQRDDLDKKRYDNNNWGDRWGNRFTRWTGWNNDNYKNNNYRDGDNDYVHQFACQFGEIKTIRTAGRKYVELEMQDGTKHTLSGEGYNDVGTDVKITDKELGDIEISWYRIDRVEFSKTPSKLEYKFGQPLFGTVEAFGSKFIGYIQWDHDERLSTDKLDGDSDDGDVAIEFGKIKSIERSGNRSRVILKSGRELYLGGSNDVNSGNRGIIVMNKDFAAIDISWRDFDKLTFDEKPAGTLLTYDQFKTQKELTATVTTRDGQSLSGKLIYDLDETYDYELLQGKQGDYEYTTPFKNIKRITTDGEHRANIELKNGTKLMLDDAQDVNELNQGALIFASGNDRPSYVPWDKIKEIEFK
jgi:hypothetical protein